MSQDRDIDVYRIGILWALHFDWRALTVSGRWGGKTWDWLKQVARWARAGKWRSVRNAFGGWHAEHAYAGTRCGTGWTRKRALADLRRHLDQCAAPSTTEPDEGVPRWSWVAALMVCGVSVVLNLAIIGWLVTR